MAKKSLAQILKDIDSMSDEEKQKLLETEFMTDEDVKPLVTNKDKILAELKEAKKRLNSQKIDENDNQLLTLIKELGIIEPDELSKIVHSGTSELEKTTLKAKQLERELEKVRKDSDTYKSQFETERNHRLDAAKRNTIAGELAKLNINPVSMDILQDYFSNRLKSVIDDSGKINVVSVDDEVTPINEVFSKWSATEQSKQFIQAPQNKGGGSSGGSGSGGTKLSLEQIAKIPDRTQRIAAMKENGMM